MEFPFTETLAAPKDGAIHHIGPCPIRRCRRTGGALLGRKPSEIRAKPAISGHFPMQDHTSPPISRKRYRTAKIWRRPARAAQGRRHAGARQGQIHRRFQPAGQAYAWIVRSSHAHGIIKGIDTAAAKDDARRARRVDRRRHGGRRLQPVHLRPAAEEPRRLAAAADQPHARWRPTRCASSAIPSPLSWPRRWRRRATPPRPSSSTSRRCRP